MLNLNKDGPNIFDLGSIAMMLICDAMTGIKAGQLGIGNSYRFVISKNYYMQNNINTRLVFLGTGQSSVVEKRCRKFVLTSLQGYDNNSLSSD
jgi:hypothetical protein